MEREGALLNRQLSNASKFADKNKISGNIVDNYRDQIQAQANKKAEAESKISSLYSDEKYAEVFKKFDVSKWVDANGAETGYYTEDINNIDKVNSKEFYELAQEFGKLLFAWSPIISETTNNVDNLSDSIKQTIDDTNQRQIDAANTATDTIIQLIQNRKEKELKALEQVHQKRTEQLQEEQELMQKAFDRATSSLDDVKSQEDYEKSLSKEQATADKLQQRIDALSQSGTEADNMAVIKLKKELKDQLEKISDMQRDHEYEQTKKALQDDLDLYNEYYDQLKESEDDQYQHSQ